TISLYRRLGSSKRARPANRDRRRRSGEDNAATQRDSRQVMLFGHKTSPCPVVPLRFVLSIDDKKLAGRGYNDLSIATCRDYRPFYPSCVNATLTSHWK